MADDSVAEKTCTRCHRSLPLDCFYRYKTRGNVVWSVCKKCDIQRHRERYNQQPRRPKDSPEKECSRCHRTLPVANFGTVPSRNNRILSRCKECDYAVLKAWRNTDVGKLSLSRSGKKRRTEHSDAIRATNERYRAKQTQEQIALKRAKEKSIRERDRDLIRVKARVKRAKFAEAYKAWRTKYLQTEKGKAVVARYVHKRRQRVIAALSTLTAKEWNDIKEAYRQRCAYCGKLKPLTMDHVIPISKGGAHVKENIAPACMSCNSSKGDKLLKPMPPDHWL